MEHQRHPLNLLSLLSLDFHSFSRYTRHIPHSSLDHHTVIINGDKCHQSMHTLPLVHSYANDFHDSRTVFGCKQSVMKQGQNHDSSTDDYN